MKFFLLSFCSLAVFSASAYAQAMVEYGLGVGRSGLAGATAGKSTGKAAGVVFDKTSKALEAAGKPNAAPSAAAANPAKPQEAAKTPDTTKAVEAAKPAATAVPPIDRAAITPGLERHELLAKLGKPSMQLTNTEGSDVVEKLWYRSPGRETVVVTLRNGKVATVSP